MFQRTMFYLNMFVYALFRIGSLRFKNLWVSIWMGYCDGSSLGDTKIQHSKTLQAINSMTSIASPTVALKILLQREIRNKPFNRVLLINGYSN